MQISGGKRERSARSSCIKNSSPYKTNREEFMIPLSESDFIDRKNQSEEPVDAPAAAALLSVVAAEEA